MGRGRPKGSKNKPKRDEYSEEVKRAEEKALQEEIEKEDKKAEEESRDDVQSKEEAIEKTKEVIEPIPA